MANIKKLLLSIILVLFFGFSYAQQGRKAITLYRTFQDYKNGIGENVGKINDFSIGTKDVYLVVDKGKNRVNVTDCWGFEIDSCVFRVFNADVYRVYDVGKIVCYENGGINLGLIISGVGWQYNNLLYFYSSTLTSEIIYNPKKFIKSLGKPESSTLKMFEEIKEAKKIKDVEKQIMAVRKIVLKYN